ncbi:MAG: hypothetical protein IJC73_00110 [Lentisphaeria bacterium]|nr:hypothetical protein [Lentisphaeria bacterium]
MAEVENPLTTGDVTNTQTRRTVRLKAPGAPAAPGSDTSNDTNTRRTVRLRPVGVPGAAGDPSSKEVMDSMSNTQTRRTVRLRPMSAPAAGTPAAAAAPAGDAPAEEFSDTVKVKKIETPEDKTIKMLRPQAAAGSTGPTSTIPGLSNQPGPRVVAAPTQPTAIKPVAAAPAPAPAPAAAPAAPAPAPAAAPAAAKPVIAPKAPAPKPLTAKPLAVKSEEEGEKKAMPPKVAMAVQKKKGSDEASPAYTALAVISAIFLLGAAVMTGVHYLNLYENQNIEVPFLSGK